MGDISMSKAETSIMKMPENVKLVSTDSHGVGSNYAGTETGGIANTTSLNWIFTGLSVAGFAAIPPTTGFIAFPSILAGLVLLIGAVNGFFFLADKVPAGIRDELESRSSLGISNDYNSSILKDGVKISTWNRSFFGIITHFLLPVRIFKKIKVHESVTYFPHQDHYVKETHYLTYGKFLRVRKTFDGHRAVFQKAIDSF
jgi:hypothetical protein